MYKTFVIQYYMEEDIKSGGLEVRQVIKVLRRLIFRNKTIYMEGPCPVDPMTGKLLVGCVKGFGLRSCSL